MTQNHYKILLIGIPEAELEVLHAVLEKHAIEYTDAKNAEVALALLQKENYLAVLLTLNLQDIYGIEFCKNLKRECPELPVIFIADS